MKAIVAFDPGVTTGIAWRDGNGIHVEQGKYSHIDLYKWCDWWHVGDIVYERFSYQRRDKVVLYPVEVIGIIKLVANTYSVHIKEQTPSQAKNLWTDSKLKRLELWKPSLPHGMDALRHLMYYLVVDKGEREWLEKLKPTK